MTVAWTAGSSSPSVCWSLDRTKKSSHNDSVCRTAPREEAVFLIRLRSLSSAAVYLRSQLRGRCAAGVDVRDRTVSHVHVRRHAGHGAGRVDAERVRGGKRDSSGNSGHTNRVDRFDSTGWLNGGSGTLSSVQRRRQRSRRAAAAMKRWGAMDHCVLFESFLPCCCPDAHSAAV